MKIQHLAAILSAAALVACTKSSPGPQVEQRLQAIESQLARIESAIQAGHSPALSATAKDQIKIYISGEVKSPGQYMVDKNITLLAGLAVAGGHTDNANWKMIAIKKRGQEQPVIVSIRDQQEVLLSEGDVVTVPKKIF